MRGNLHASKTVITFVGRFGVSVHACKIVYVILDYFGSSLIFVIAVSGIDPKFL